MDTEQNTDQISSCIEAQFVDHESSPCNCVSHRVLTDYHIFHEGSLGPWGQFISHTYWHQDLPRQWGIAHSLPELCATAAMKCVTQKVKGGHLKCLPFTPQNACYHHGTMHNSALHPSLLTLSCMSP